MRWDIAVARRYQAKRRSAMRRPMDLSPTGSRAAGREILRTEGISSGYGLLPVVREVSIRVNKGEVVALLGANGAGKTTTLLTVCGYLNPLAGDIYFQGSKLSGPMHRRCRNGIGFVPEAKAVFPTLTTAENLRLGAGGVEGAVELMPELKHLLERRAGLLSGGEQQIMVLARVLASTPSLIIADELSLGLAPSVVTRLLGAIRAAADSGAGVLIVEQYVRRALDIADRVYVMRRGSIEMSGTTAQVRSRLDEVEGLYLSTEPG